MQRRGRLGARLGRAFQSASLGRSPLPARPTELAVGLALARYGRITARFAPAATCAASGSPVRRLQRGDGSAWPNRTTVRQATRRIRRQCDGAHTAAPAPSISAVPCEKTVARGDRRARRPPERPRRLIPPHGGRVLPHARRLGDGLRGRPAALRGAAGGDREPAAPGPAVPPEARLRPLRAGPPALDRRPVPQPALPRAEHGAAATGFRGAAQAPGRARLLPAA